MVFFLRSVPSAEAEELRQALGRMCCTARGGMACSVGRKATRGQLDQAGIAPTADEAGVRPLIPATLDTGYFSGPAVAAIDPYIATERRHAQAPLRHRVAAEPPPATAKEKMQAKLSPGVSPVPAAWSGPDPW